MLRIPGFIDIGTDISGGSWRPISAAALRGGYTSLLAAPVAEKVYTEKADVLAALDEPSRSAACDYAKLALITPENIRTVGDWADEVPAADEDAEPDETATEEGENASGEAETAEGEKKERPEKPEGFDPSNLPEGFDPSNLPERPENGEKPNN